ncbi:response regulator [Cryomorphaceae bacterium]|nr:response regulator [Cryomorphaceae bacterium]
MSPSNLLRLIALTFLFFFTQVHGSSDPFGPSLNAYFQYELLTTEEGLSQGLVEAVLEDHEGYLWLGTPGGLDRYDGSSFLHFYHNPLDSNSLSVNGVHLIFEDSKHRIWLGLSDQSINVISPDRKHVHRIQRDTNMIDDRTGRVRQIMEHPDGRIVLLDYKGRIGFLEAGSTFEEVKALEQWSGQKWAELEFGRSLGSVLTIDISGDTLWVGSMNHLFYGVLSRESEPEWKEVSIFDEGKEPFDWAGDYYRFVQCNGNVVHLGTDDGRMIQYDLLKEQSSLIDFRERFPDIMVGSYLQDEYGTYWVSTFQGVFLYDPVADTAIFPARLNDRDYTLLAQCMIRTTGGQIVIGGNGRGLFICSPGDVPFSYYGEETRRAGNEAFIRYYPKIRKGPEGELIVLYRDMQELDLRSSVLSPFGDWANLHPSRTDRFNVQDFHVDRYGNQWVATQSGVIRRNPNGEVRFWDRSHEGGYGAPSWIRKLYETRDGRILGFCTRYMLTYIPEEDNFIRQPFSTDSVTVWDNSVNAVYEDSEGALWLGTYWGLHVVHPDGRFEQKFPGIRITDFIAQNDQELFVATRDGGLLRFDLKKGDWKTYGVQEGLTNTTVYALENDRSGQIWLSTNRGLFQFDPEKETFQNYVYGTGIQGNEFNMGSSLVLGDKLFFGGMKGLTAFSPEQFKGPGSESPVLCSSIMQYASGGLVERTPNANSEAPWTFNAMESRRLEFSFFWPNFSHTHLHRYEYALQGRGEGIEWAPVPGGNKLTLSEPSTGKYLLLVRAVDWSGRESPLSFKQMVVFRPPWYKSPTAFTLYLMALVFGGVAFLRFQKKRLELRAELQFERNEAARIRELESAKTRFFSNISHEFKTPLTLLLGPIRDLFKDSKDAKERYLLNIAQRNGRDLLQLISQLLDLNKYEEGMLEAHYLQGELTGFVQSVVDRMMPMATQRGISVDLQMPEPRHLGFDGPKLERILVNILANALKYAKDNGRVRLIVNFESEDFTLSIEDDGPGIPEKNRADLFKPFYQVKGKDAYRAGGTGIGLALCKTYVELMEGRIDVSVSEWGGALFTIRLPYHQAEAVEDDYSFEEQESHTSAEIEGYEPNEERGEDTPLILIAEDNEDLRAYLRISLFDDYRILEAPNGIEALRIAQETIPDIVLSDVMMPEMDGIQLSSKLKDEHDTCHIPVILLSALSALETRLKALESGADDYMVKPFSKEELLLRLRNMLTWKTSLQEAFRSKYSDAQRVSEPIPSEDPFLQKLDEVMQEHFEDPEFDVQQLCSALAVSRSKLHRKLKAVTGLSATQFVRSFRLNKAMKLLVERESSVKEVGYSVGFNSSSYFTRCFTEHFGYAPSQVEKA